MTEERQHPDELTQEELDELNAEELPTREALTVVRVPWLTNLPVEPPDTELPEA